MKLGATICGVSTYGLVMYWKESWGTAAFVGGIGIIIFGLGWLFRLAADLSLPRNWLLDHTSSYLGSLFIVLAFAGVVRDGIIEPVRLAFMLFSFGLEHLPV